MKNQPKKKKAAAVKKPSIKTLQAYNELIKRGIPVLLNEQGDLIVDPNKVNVSIKYTKDGKQYATFELREEGAEEVTKNYDSVMEHLKLIYDYIQDYERQYFENNPELSELIKNDELGVTTQTHQHIFTMIVGIQIPLFFLKKYAFLINAYEKGRIQIIN